MKLGDKSIQPEEKLTRIYPESNLFSHIIGQIDNDNNGISGLEKKLDGIYADQYHDGDLDPDAIADVYWQFLQQPPNARAWEIELRPNLEVF